MLDQQSVHWAWHIHVKNKSRSTQGKEVCGIERHWISPSDPLAAALFPAPLAAPAIETPLTENNRGWDNVK